VTVTSACVLLPAWEAVFATCCLRRVHPPGVARRPSSASGVASWCRLQQATSPGPPRLRSWSRMTLTIQDEAASAPRSSQRPTLR